MRLIVILTGFAMAFSAPLSSNALAATDFGDDCAATGGEPDHTVLQLSRGSGSTLPLTAPSDGIVTSWTVRVAPEFAIQGAPVKLLLLRPTPTPSEFRVVGESADSGAGQPAFTTKTRIAIEAGDRLGLYGLQGSGTPVCNTGGTGDELGFLPGAAALGSTHTFTLQAGFRVPVSATLEADRDGDGYGDETQDACPQSGAYHDACPRLTLNIVRARVRTHSIVLRIRASAEAVVHVFGQVGWGFESSDKPLPGHDKPTRLIVGLRGGTKTVVAGKATVFRVQLPKAVLRRLGRITAREELKARLTASATELSGRIESDPLTVHLKGRNSG